MRLGLLLLLGIATPVSAQGFGVQVGRFFGDTGRTVVQVGLTRNLASSVGTNLYGTWMHGKDPLGNLWGAGLDLTLFRSGSAGLYFAGGVSGGFAVSAPDAFWGSWSAGGGYEFFPANGLSLAFEGRYRSISVRPNHGAEFSVRIGFDKNSRNRKKSGSGSSNPAAASAASLPPPDSFTIAEEARRSGATEEGADLAAAVVNTATAAMGTPYRWGGSSNGGNGFDCSGLIQYAYGQHGVQLPRTSGQQAEQGNPVDRRVDSLRPGDILTFSSQGGQVTHVGLYVGEGRFIHSASTGVQLSLLSGNDPYGRWWWDRWVGARRVIR